MSVVAVNYNSGELLCRCLAALRHNACAPRLELIVVDNASHDGSLDLVRARYPDARVIANGANRGFGAACNQAFELARAPYLLLANPDALPEPGTLDALLAVMEQDPACGLCGGQLVDLRGEPVPSGRRFPSVWGYVLTRVGLEERFEPRLARAESADWVPGTFLLLRRALIETLGGFDERFFLYFEETDLCRRARRAGWRVAIVTSARIRHDQGASARTRREAFDAAGSQVLPWRLRSEYLYFRKHHGLTAVIADAGFEIAWNLARAAYNLRPGRREVRRNALLVARHALAALVATACGGKAPPTPW